MIRDFDSLNEEDHVANLQRALDISEREFGIQPFMSALDLRAGEELDKTRMIAYLSKFYELFRGTPLPTSGMWPRVNTFFVFLFLCPILFFIFLFKREETYFTDE